MASKIVLCVFVAFVAGAMAQSGCGCGCNQGWAGSNLGYAGGNSGLGNQALSNGCGCNSNQGWGGSNLGYAGGNGNAGLGNQAYVATGGGLGVTTYSPITPSGVSLLSDNGIDGPLNICGGLPVLSAVAFEGQFPTSGSSGVQYSCGNGVGINNAGGIGNAGINGAGLGYGGCGCSAGQNNGLNLNGLGFNAGQAELGGCGCGCRGY